MTNSKAAFKFPCSIMILPRLSASKSCVWRSNETDANRSAATAAAKEPGMLQKKSAITPGNPPYLVQGLLESSARLPVVKRSLDASNPQQSRYPHVRLCCAAANARANSSLTTDPLWQTASKLPLSNS